MEKLKVAFINKFGETEVKLMIQPPRIGDKVDIFYSPMPTVKEVVWFSSQIDADVIIILE